MARACGADRAVCVRRCAVPGKPLRKSEHPNPCPFDEVLLTERETSALRAKWNAAAKYLELRDRGQLKFQREYNDYLLSPEWKRRRKLVIERCSGLCEGCMERRAQEVHHFTYKNFGNEFLFELVALCEPCHSRSHSHSDNDGADSRPCRGCRFQSEDAEICPIFEVSETLALSDPRYCGPKLQGFKALK